VGRRHAAAGKVIPRASRLCAALDFDPALRASERIATMVRNQGE
jgi:hypothetical protein